MWPRLLLVTALLVSLASSTALAEPFETALANALRQHPTLAQAERGREIAAAADQLARARTRPSLEVGARAGLDYDRDPGDQGGLGFGRRADLRMTWALWDGGEAAALRQDAAAQRLIAQLSVAKLRQDVTLLALTRYLSLLRARALMQLAARREAVEQRRLRLAQARLQEGGGDRPAITLAELRLRQAEGALARQEGALMAAQAEARSLFGGPLDLAQLGLPTLPADALPGDADTLAADAAALAPAVRLADQEIRRRGAGRLVAEAGQAVRLNAVGRAEVGLDENGKDGLNASATLGLEARWALADGGATAARIRTAALQEEDARDGLRAARLSAEEAAGVAWAGLLAARRQHGLAQRALLLAQEVTAALRERLRTGGGAPEAVLDAEAQEIAAQEAEMEARLEVVVHEGRVLHAAGSLDPALFAPPESVLPPEAAMPPEAQATLGRP